MKPTLFFCSIVLLAIGCRKNNNSDDKNNPDRIFPNKPGDIWVYNVTDSMYTFQNLDSVKAYDMIVSVTGRTVIPGDIVASIWVYDSPLGSDTNFVFQNGDTMNFAVNRGNYLDIVRRYVFPFRLRSSWEYSSNSVHNVTVDSIASISVGPNYFDRAYHLSGFPGRPDQIVGVDEWIKDSVGVVKKYLNTSTTNNPVKHHTLWSILNYSLH